MKQLNLGNRFAIFDMDGTLIDSNTMLVNAARDYLSRHSRHLSDEIVQQLLPLNMEQCCALLKQSANDERPLDLILQEINREAAWHYDNDVPAKPYARQYLRLLKDHGIKMAVASATGQDQVCSALARLDLLRYFEFVITVNEVGHSKREPHIFIEAAQRLGCRSCGEATVYDDSLAAIRSAKAAGCKTVAVYDDLCRDEAELIRQYCDYYMLGFGDLL